MKKRTIAAIVVIVSSSQTGYAHDVEQEQYLHEELISDLNALAASFTPDDISNQDVVFVSSVTCATMRMAIREQFAERIGPILRERYPSSEDIETIETMDFIAFEEEAFSNLGATKQALELVYWSIQENPIIPPNPPAEDGALVEDMAALEDISCELRAVQLGDLTEPAAPEPASLTRALANAVVGTAVMVIDAKIAVDTAGLASVILGMSSGGWGWNRVEEAASEALEIWQAWVR